MERNRLITCVVAGPLQPATFGTVLDSKADLPALCKPPEQGTERTMTQLSWLGRPLKGAHQGVSQKQTFPQLPPGFRGPNPNPVPTGRHSPVGSVSPHIA